MCSSRSPDSIRIPRRTAATDAECLKLIGCQKALKFKSTFKGFRAHEFVPLDVSKLIETSIAKYSTEMQTYDTELAALDFDAAKRHYACLGN